MPILIPQQASSSPISVFFFPPLLGIIIISSLQRTWRRVKTRAHLRIVTHSNALLPRAKGAPSNTVDLVSVAPTLGRGSSGLQGCDRGSNHSASHSTHHGWNYLPTHTHTHPPTHPDFVRGVSELRVGPHRQFCGCTWTESQYGLTLL